MSIHPNTAIDSSAKIHSEAEIGPFCVVGPGVTIGPHTRLLSNVVVQRDTHIGAHNTIYPFASVGCDPQDLKYQGEKTQLEIGDYNIIRESATVSRGTAQGGGLTRIGNRCLLMNYSHVAHDCLLGNEVILANSAGLAGHVEIADKAIVGAMAGVHQFCKIGRNAFLAGGAMVAMNVPPFVMVRGDRARFHGLNTVGLQRSGFSAETIAAIKKSCKLIYGSSKLLNAALQEIEALYPGQPEIAELVEFVKSSDRGICR